ncbi:hypothetical protein K7W42_12695 [Deinococcus sp. HMF7604]|uniref:hypothetical protein n=1 Tax=Deinococcus betulae TaxID=2873312 RepID=UPI001CCFB84A|nr:hypothetical protein [Deinococcus betulae]MBZ9751721.1 hypothetical protein [Deinococcus betulae]
MLQQLSALFSRRPQAPDPAQAALQAALQALTCAAAEHTLVRGELHVDHTPSGEPRVLAEALLQDAQGRCHVLTYGEAATDLRDTLQTPDTYQPGVLATGPSHLAFWYTLQSTPEGLIAVLKDEQPRWTR